MTTHNEAPTTDARTIAQILKEARTIAVVGLSDELERPSYRVARYLKAQGYRIIPVNPEIDRALDEPTYPTLDAIPEPVDIVEVFRRPQFVPPLAEAAARIRAQVLWLQDGIVHEEAAAAARAAGLTVIQNDCLARWHRRLSMAGEL